MNEFFQAVRDYQFLRYALLAGALSGIACGVVGSYVVTRRISYIAGGISHCVLGGIGAAVYLQKACGMEWANPFYGAIAAALISSTIIGMVVLRARQREDTVISALWAVGMAAGIMFMSRTPGYNKDLMSYLFGNILVVSREDLMVIAALDVVVAAVCGLYYKQFLALCFDEEFARARGMNVEFLFLLLLALTALTTVILISVVGIVLVIALLTLPAAIAAVFSRTLWKIMLLAVVICSFFTMGGIALSYGPDLPAGAMAIMIAGASYMLVSLGTALRGKLTSRKNAEHV